VSLTIFKKGVVLIALPLVAQGVLVGILAWLQGRYAEAQSRALHTKEVLEVGRRIEGGVIEAQSGARGYVLTGDRAFVAHLDRAGADLDADAARLVALVADSPPDRDRARRVAHGARRAMAWQADLVRLADTAGRPAAGERVRTQEGKALVDGLRADLGEFIREEERLDAEREAEVDRIRQTVNGLLVGGIVVGFAGTVGLAVFFSRGISRRLAVVAENARRLAAGRELAPEVGGGDEIAQVDRAFRQMAAEIGALNRTLEDRVRARTAELDRANAALRVEEGRFRSAFDDTDVAMVLTDLDNRFVRANAAFARMFGYTPDEVLRLTMADVTHPEDMAESYAQRARLVAGEAQFFQMENRYRHKDGRVLWGLTNVSLVRGPAGEPLMYVGQVQDITERRRAEEAVRQRTAELTEANRELAQKNQENELFVYSVSHDLRGPLVNLQGFSKELGKAADALRALLADERTPADVRAAARPLLDEKVAKAVGFIQSAVARLGGIIDALLRLSRAGRVEYRRERVEMNRLVGQVVSSLQGTIAEKRATVGAGNLTPTHGDATALGQVFANLLGNALTYLDPARPGRVEIGEAPGPDGWVTYFVRDNGLGIPAAAQPKVFQLFQRAHPGVGTGEGLGLAIVARVVERHRGRAWVESTEGVGSTFYVRLPAPPDETGGGS
jgi:PAS domain S-box-containing protein